LVGERKNAESQVPHPSPIGITANPRARMEEKVCCGGKIKILGMK
jgi:hypothetical protein